MEWNQLKYFYEVAKHGSFTKASQSLKISQPSLSKMVSQLEQSEKQVFLERNKHGVRLTPMGEILFEGCERMFSQFEGLKEAIAQKGKECSGVLSIGASDNVSNYLFPELLAVFQKNNPGVLIKITSGTSREIRSQLKEFKVELGFFYTQVREKELETQVLMDVEFVIVAAQGLKLADLKKQGYVGSQSTDYSRPYVAMRLLRSVGLSPEVRVEANSLETQKRLVLSGIGFTVLPRPMVISEIKAGNLKEIKVPKKLASPLYQVKRHSRVLSEAAVLWERHLRTELKI